MRDSNNRFLGLITFINFKNKTMIRMTISIYYFILKYHVIISKTYKVNQTLESIFSYLFFIDYKEICS